MEIKMNPREQFPGRGPCIQMVGDWVTEDVWNVVNRLLQDNWTTSPVYQARTKAHAFFQGGHSDARGKWILIEFWATEEKCQDFIKILNKEVNKVINPFSAKICVVANSNNAKDKQIRDEVCAMIADEAKCAMGDENEAASLHCSAVFLPKDNLEYANVHFLLDHTFFKEVKRINHLDKWEQEGMSRHG